jgi:hypothetical protein
MVIASVLMLNLEKIKQNKKQWVNQISVVHAYNPSNQRDRGSGKSQLESSPRQIVHEALSQKYPTHTPTPQHTQHKKTGLVEWLKW